MTTVAAVLLLAERLGWPLFPCGGDKAPLTEHGFKDASSEPKRIRAWARRHPGCLWGVPTGAASGLFVLDVDLDEAEGIDGREALDALTASIGPLPGTVEAITPRGGWHLYYAQPAGTTTRSTAGKLGRGLDTRGDGGYVIVPPSCANGRGYEWEASSAPGEIPFASLPGAWLSLVSDPPSNGHAAGESDVEILGGERNVTLTSCAGAMRRRGMTRQAIEAALLADNAARCTPPLPDPEVRTIAASVARYPADPAVNALISLNAQGDAPENWPVLGDDALHGLSGEFVRMVLPDTEADPAALLVQFLVAFGSLVGRGPHCRREADEHHGNLFAVLVGATSKARKGSSWSRVLEVFKRIPEWKPHVSGLSTGEGLKYLVRDARQEIHVDKKTGEQTVEVVDVGVTDKRLLVVQGEFVSVLQVGSRPGNTLSPTLREAWDGGRLSTLTKSDPTTATGAHISIIAHITMDELRLELTATDRANGYANRYLFVMAKRSKKLPFGGPKTDAGELMAVVQRVRERMLTARTRQQISMTKAAETLWVSVYDELSEGAPGLRGAIVARAEAQVTRLALLYCLLDGAAQIDEPHLKAALALWSYCDTSVSLIFGAALGDRIADELLRRLRQAGDAGMTLTEISGVFGRHQSAERRGAALELLRQKGKVTCEPIDTGGRPSELWKAVK